MILIYSHDKKRVAVFCNQRKQPPRREISAKILKNGLKSIKSKNWEKIPETLDKCQGG